jgi:hypothetical protein
MVRLRGLVLVLPSGVHRPIAPAALGQCQASHAIRGRRSDCQHPCHFSCSPCSGLQALSAQVCKKVIATSFSPNFPNYLCLFLFPSLLRMCRKSWKQRHDRFFTVEQSPLPFMVGSGVPVGMLLSFVLSHISTRPSVHIVAIIFGF